MGLSKPVYPALSNAAKLMTYVVGVPIAFFLSGFTAAVAGSAGELVKYIALWLLTHNQHLRFGRDDLVLTIAFAGSSMLVGEALRMVGLGPGLAGVCAHILTAAGA